ncbi:MAG: hypothetical protein B1H04_02685 [Planctomycetales bacterium 4484_123]|nr:MAG: hypothetical protein B1H04_02685 [Planctomycetales bacterium 4484_123]
MLTLPSKAVTLAPAGTGSASFFRPSTWLAEPTLTVAPTPTLSGMLKRTSAQCRRPTWRAVSASFRGEASETSTRPVKPLE